MKGQGTLHSRILLSLYSAAAPKRVCIGNCAHAWRSAKSGVGHLRRNRKRKHDTSFVLIGFHDGCVFCRRLCTQASFPAAMILVELSGTPHSLESSIPALLITALWDRELFTKLENAIPHTTENQNSQCRHACTKKRSNTLKLYHNSHIHTDTSSPRKREGSAAFLLPREACNLCLLPLPCAKRKRASS